MSTQIVVDTSVLVSAFIGKRGASREVLRRCLTGQYLPLISNALFQECEEVLTRRHIIKACPLSVTEMDELRGAYYSVCHWVPVYFLWRPNLADEDDNFLIELALAGGSEIVVTNNIKDLKTAELTFDELKVLTPGQLLKER